ncbi:AKNA factor, partial [Eulacestoma nigropectus]|nr:AKNA factor [Eulacestoma nigropectus]
SPTGVPSPQDDYHKLLTKYAEAENTIDQLRLGARVSLFSDPPQPSRSLAVGSVGTGCRVMTLSIPQARTAALGMATAPATAPAPPGAGVLIRVPCPAPRPPASWGPPCCGVTLSSCFVAAAAPGPSERGGSPQPRSPPLPEGGCPTCPGPCCCPGPRLTRALAGQSRRLQAQVRAGGLGGGALGVQRFPTPLQLWGVAPLTPFCCAQQSPALVESPRGTAGDSEGVAGGLPWPLWHKQRQVEEDFGDLLEQYQHLKSLPESLSLERLSLAESGSQEEVDAPTAGHGGPSKGPCRTRSLEEGPSLESLPLHLPERRAATLPPRGPPNLRDARGHPSPGTAEEPPASAKPPLRVPGPPGVPLSRRSSGAGSAATQHGPRKVSPCRCGSPAASTPRGSRGAGHRPCSPPPLQEQRIVSPETDSGFVGSEASRVSPPVPTPEHHPAGTGTPGSLGPSIPIPTTLRTPRKRGTTPLPSESALMGIYPPRGTGGPRLPPSSPSQSSSPPRWAESSEAGPDPDGGGSDTGGPPAPMARSPTSPLPSPRTPSPTLLSPDLPSPDPAPCGLLGSRLERDQAIRALQDEVWRLRRRLEESLRRSRSYPEGKATPRVTPARRPPVASGPWSPQDAAPSGDPSPPGRGRVAPGVTPTRRERSASLPRDRPELHLGDPPGAVTLRGQCTGGCCWWRGWGRPPSPRGAWPCSRRALAGTRYQAGPPRATPAPREEPGTSGCPRCHRGRTASAGFGGGDAPRQPQRSTPRRTSCPTCRAPVGAPGSRDRAT